MRLSIVPIAVGRLCEAGVAMAVTVAAVAWEPRFPGRPTTPAHGATRTVPVETRD
ncbi:hypothetical protein [Natrinema gelatinilyticum]|uniref:hypothetical protein n=1 Tax=Natrinema gelatinilyticum TaxID=2961571 RepID=UPI0020C2E52B|nr:hypothetical protein [Natrinema gelatinilyticum]